jgi:hypothetical protein
MLGAMAVGVTKLLLRNAGITYWRDDVMPRYLATIARWKAVDPAHASDEQLLDGVRALARADALYWFAVALAMGTAKSTDVALDRFLAFTVRGGPSSARLLRGFGSKVLDAEAELEGIATDISGSDALRILVEATPAQQLLEALERDPSADSVLEGLQRYFERYGHQIYSLDFAVPTQGEDPMPVLLSLKSLVLSPGRNVRTRQAELARERERLAAETEGSLGPFRRLLFRRILRAAQRFAPYREESLFYIGAGWPTLRRLALELGRRLVAAGSLFEPGGVFYLQTAELAAGSAARVAGQSGPSSPGWPASARSCARRAGGCIPRPRCRPTSVGRWAPSTWPGASRSGATRSPGRRCAGSRSAPAASPPPPALSCRRQTSPRCGPTPYSSAQRPRPRGPHCSARRAAWSPTLGASPPTAPSSPGSTASQPSWAPATRHNGSPAADWSPSTVTPAR